MINRKFYDKKVVFIGSGNMAEAIVAGFIRNDIIARTNIFCNDISSDRLNIISKKYAVNTMQDKTQILENAEIVFLAVKPQHLPNILEEYSKDIAKAKIIVSVVAGVTTNTIAKYLPDNIIIRVMPNTPALVGQGAIAVCGGSKASAENVSDIADLFSVVGRVEIVKEKIINAITAVSGSGPAYVFYLSEIMRDVAEKFGIPSDVAKELVYQTIYGAGKMLKESGLDDVVLRKHVTSPGGTTEKAIEDFEKNNFRQIVFSAIDKARKRAEEL